MDYSSEGKIIRRTVIGKSAPECQRSFFKWACTDFPVAMCLGRAGDFPVACCPGGSLLIAADLGVAAAAWGPVQSTPREAVGITQFLSGLESLDANRLAYNLEQEEPKREAAREMSVRRDPEAGFAET